MGMFFYTHLFIYAHFFQEQNWGVKHGLGVLFVLIVMLNVELLCFHILIADCLVLPCGQQLITDISVCAYLILIRNIWSL
jgi:hypothetical protein